MSSEENDVRMSTLTVECPQCGKAIFNTPPGEARIIGYKRSLTLTNDKRCPECGGQILAQTPQDQETLETRVEEEVITLPYYVFGGARGWKIGTSGYMSFSTFGHVYRRIGKYRFTATRSELVEIVQEKFFSKAKACRLTALVFIVLAIALLVCDILLFSWILHTLILISCAGIYIARARRLSALDQMHRVRDRSTAALVRDEEDAIRLAFVKSIPGQSFVGDAKVPNRTFFDDKALTSAAEFSEKEIEDGLWIRESSVFSEQEFLDLCRSHSISLSDFGRVISYDWLETIRN